MKTGSVALLRIEPDVVPDVVANARVHALSSDATAEQAAQLMRRTAAGAVVIVDPEGKFAGLLTDGDLVREVVAKGLAAGAVKLGSLVNPHPECLAPSDLVLDAFDLMRVRNVNHLPVIFDGRVTAIVSIGDLCAALRRSLEDQLRSGEAAVFGDLLRR